MWKQNAGWNITRYCFDFWGKKRVFSAQMIRDAALWQELCWRLWCQTVVALRDSSFVAQVVAKLDILHLWRPAFAVSVHLHWKGYFKNDEDFSSQSNFG